jgi:hypothetical protein
MVDGTPSSKPEFPPLFPIGRHKTDLFELRNLCTDGFPLSTTRSQIMVGLEKVINKLKESGIQGEVWIDGSFVTEKINPEDSDLVLRISAEFYDNASPNQRDTVGWLLTDLKKEYLCHSKLFMEWPEGHGNYWLGQYFYSYWMKQFGFSRGEEIKGIPVIVL